MSIGENYPKLIAGKDYPRNYREFVFMFPDDKACVQYLEKLRWPTGFVCPRCQEESIPWRHTRNRLVCPNCRNQTSVTAGTILDKTRTPLTTWFDAAWHLTTSKNGMSAKTLEITLGTSYRVAWTMLQRYRVAMVRAERSKLSGIVEVDETMIGGVGKDGKRGRGAQKSIVVIGVEIKEPKGFGRLRMRHVTDASGDSLLPFIVDTICPDETEIRTDGWKGYNDLSNQGYSHKRTILSGSDDPAHESMPGVHQVAGLLKRWIMGTHHGAILPIHLQSYLEEFTFRFNRRTSRNRGLVFRRLLEQASITEPVTEADVLHGYKWTKN
jgi:transposase-like protein